MAVRPHTECSPVFQPTDFMTPNKKHMPSLTCKFSFFSAHKTKCSHLSICFPMTDPWKTLNTLTIKRQSHLTQPVRSWGCNSSKPQPVLAGTMASHHGGHAPKSSNLGASKQLHPCNTKQHPTNYPGVKFQSGWPAACRYSWHLSEQEGSWELTIHMKLGWIRID